MKENIILEKTLDYAVLIISLAKSLRNSGEFDLARQVIKSGTSIGANVHEAQDSSSKAEFTYKMDIALREAKETRYWLKVFAKSDLKNLDLTECQNQIEEIVAILLAISQSNNKYRKNR